MPEISTDAILEMDRANRDRLDKLERGQDTINRTLGSMNVMLASISERLKDQKDLKEDVDSLEADINRAKGAGRAATYILGVAELGHWVWGFLRK